MKEIGVAMIAIPANGASIVAIDAAEKKAKAYLNSVDKFYVTMYCDFNHPIQTLANTLFFISVYCDSIYFSHGWHDDFMCRILHDIAAEYGLEIIYEE